MAHGPGSKWPSRNDVFHLRIDRARYLWNIISVSRQIAFKRLAFVTNFDIANVFGRDVELKGKKQIKFYK